MGQALYRKHRPKRLSEIVGQEHITTTLDNALKQGRISHAYLFTGPRGVGKTSIARILAHEVNGLPYDEEATHLDIIEIDAASNRRIDEIRELRERVHTAPASAKYKVYIIDEVHMLTKEAFNALLKTLEEPPAHVIFILATTEAHKLPETIVSRTQRFTFKPVDQDQVVKHLAAIAKEEKISISPEALELIAQHGGGSFRDSISLLDQAGNGVQKVELGDVQRMLGIAPEQAILDLVAILQTGSVGDLVVLLSQFRNQGYQAAQLAKQLAAHLRNSLVQGKVPFAAEQVSLLLHQLLNVPASHDPAASLELVLVDQIISRQPLEITSAGAKQPNQAAPQDLNEAKVKETPAVNPPTTEAPKPEPQAIPPTPPTKETPKQPTSKNGNFNDSSWQEVLNEIKKTHNTLYGLARMAQARIDGMTLTLAFAFPFHQKRLNEAKNKQVISELIAKISGSEVEIICVVDKDLPAKATNEPALTNPPIHPQPETKDALDAISNIFGSAEIIE